MQSSSHDHPAQGANQPLLTDFDGLVAGTGAPRLRLPSSARDGEYLVRSRGCEEEWHVTVQGGASADVPWPGSPLQSRERRVLDFRSTDSDEWSAELAIEAGLLSPQDWSAQFVTATTERGIPVFRHTFPLSGDVEHARLYSTYLGVGRIRINGEPVGDEALEPGWESYDHRLVVRAHDVASLLRSGTNEITAEVAPGWYSGRLGFFGENEHYGSGVGVLAQLEVSEPSGAVTVVATGADWTWRPGATISAELYDGEVFDARRRTDQGSTPTDWSAVQIREYPFERLEFPLSPPVRKMESITPASIFTAPSGATIVDFGRNVVGWTRLSVDGDEGTEIRLRHAEVLEHGELGTRPLRTAAATDRYILDGSGRQVWEPSFTYHGFRYVEVVGWPGGQPAPGEIEAVVAHSDLPRTGWFRTSHRDLAQLHENVVASLQGNFVSIPTDCPQRDERLGWTGDIAVFAPTAAFLYDCSAFLRSWLRDVAHEQDADGRIPLFVPDLRFPEEAALADPQFDSARPAVWGDVATLLPFALYESTGDANLIAENFELMRKWVDGTLEAAGPDGVWDTGFQFGDWLDPAAPPEAPADGLTETALIATAYLAHSTHLTARAARMLGADELADYYEGEAARVRAGFGTRFLRDDLLLTSDSQTAYAIGLRLGLLDGEARIRGAERLIELVREAGHRIGTGFVGTPLILEALTDAGSIDDAYRLLLQRESPSWLYAVSMGGTTIWERWDSMLPDGSINPGEMTSFNHYALGAVAEWLHTTVAGLSPAAPGYSRIRIAPRPWGPVQDAGATHRTPFGDATIDWRVDGDELEVTVTIPPGTVAEFDLEGVDRFERGAGTHAVRVPVALRGLDDAASDATTAGGSLTRV